MTTHAHVRWTTRPKTPAAQKKTSAFACRPADSITIRIVGVSRAIITRLTPETKRSTQIVATDAARSQIFGHTTLFAYGNAPTDAFDTTRIRATNRATSNLVDETTFTFRQRANTAASDRRRFIVPDR
ncbi:hypothetical protein [Rhodococcus sp. BH5]|uniref:hypothetical protein n=1 Tax=Rhodococcus sp. BH5 TaxID=2871702 RepID=UPI0022CDB4D7|nr:hypothetical protein [Rhodococcus sp. BH5]MCZ9635088.1 hypothetical protein [Rhodococcus sp. BH5]